MRRPARLCATLIAAALAVTAPAAAEANSTIIGSSLNHPWAAYSCTGCIGVQYSASPGLSLYQFQSPVNGTVTSWSVRSADATALYALRILRPFPTTAGAYTSAGRSVAPSAFGTSTDSIQAYSSSLKIKQGDSIGVELASGGTGLPDHFTGAAGDIDAYTLNFADGATVGFTTSVTGHELLLQATISYCQVPNLLHDKTALAVSQLAAASCGATVKKKKVKNTKKNRKRKKGKVLGQDLAPATTVSPGTPVTITVGKLKK